MFSPNYMQARQVLRQGYRTCRKTWAWLDMGQVRAFSLILSHFRSIFWLGNLWLTLKILSLALAVENACRDRALLDLDLCLNRTASMALEMRTSKQDILRSELSERCVLHHEVIDVISLLRGRKNRV
jgi:hypothetical protein